MEIPPPVADDVGDSDTGEQEGQRKKKAKPIQQGTCTGEKMGFVNMVES
jgi:hypothetical protein